MNKHEFIDMLRKRLSHLPQQDIEERLSFYSEMIDDRIEEGLSEDEAVLQVGDIDEMVSQITADYPKSKKQHTHKKRTLKAWEIALLAVGSPIWASLLIAAFAVVLSLYISLWSVIISLWAVFASFIGCALGGVIACTVFVCGGNVATGIATIGCSAVLAGLSIFLFFGCKAATGGTVWLTKRVAIGTKNYFCKKEGV